MTKSKFNYEVTFSNGFKLTRSSTKEFKYAWFCLDSWNNKYKGFSSNREAAIKESKKTIGHILFSEIIELS